MSDEKAASAAHTSLPGRTDPALLNAARKQLAIVVAAEDGAPYLGWWLAWSNEPGINRDDLVDLMKEMGLPRETAP